MTSIAKGWLLAIRVTQGSLGSFSFVPVKRSHASPKQHLVWFVFFQGVRRLVARLGQMGDRGSWQSSSLTRGETVIGQLRACACAVCGADYVKINACSQENLRAPLLAPTRIEAWVGN